MIYKMTLADSTDSMTFDLLEVPIADKDIEGAVDNTLVNGNVFTDYLWLKKQWTQKWALMCDDEYTQLRGFYTRQWENAEAPTYRLFYGNNVTEDVMHNGSYITENIDAPLGAEMTLTQLSGNATQQTYSGKNLLDIPDNLNASSHGLNFSYASDGTLSWSGTPDATYALVTTNYLTSLVPAGTYTFSLNKTLAHRIYILCTLADSTQYTFIIEPNALSSTHTFTQAVTRMRLDFAGLTSGTAYSNNVKIMLEAGSSASPFEPYVGGTASPNPDYPQDIQVVTGENTITITDGDSQSQSHVISLGSLELAKIGTYQDKIYFDADTSKWMLHKEVGKVVYDGSQNWSGGTSSGSPSYLYVYNSAIDSLSLWSESAGISSHFTIEDAPLTTSSIKSSPCMSLSIASAAQSYHVRAFVPLTIASTVSAFKTWLASNPTTVYYALATPTDTEITNETLLSQLNFIASLYGGVNHISLVPTGGAQGEMEVKIHKIYEQETEIYPQTAVRLTLTDDGIINPCGCRRNVQIKMRETIQ